MNYTKEDIEFYLIHKEYHELSSDELGFISSEVKSENEFNQLKKLMVSLIDEKVNETDIQPDPAIKSVLMREFREKSKINKVWYNSLLIQLFPKEKSIYRMPGVQLAGIAASLLLVLNIFILNDPIKKDNHVALNNNDSEKEEKTTSLEDGIEEGSASGSISEDFGVTQPIEKPVDEVELSEKNIITEIDVPEEDEVIHEMELVFTDEVEEEIIIAEELNESANFESRSLDVTTMDLNNLGGVDTKEMLPSKKEEVEAIEETLLLGGFTEPTTVVTGNVFNDTAIEEMEINTDMRTTEISKGRVRNKNTVIKSRSLDDDKELIELFFTAL